MEELKIFYGRLAALSPSMRVLITLVAAFVIISLIAVPPATLGFFMKVFGFSTIALLIIAMWKDWTLLMIDQIAEKYFNKPQSEANHGNTGTRDFGDLPVQQDRAVINDDEEEAEDSPHHQGSRPDQ
ncbi:MAG: hypothetical protein E6R03_02830 [Hyphomicrobiaceae bacterium]|nr:MAG: hypothetical protein E6R03_02830 [Hyphomicrobiaceae bacterium]